MKISRIVLACLLIATGFGLAFHAGIVYAADQRLIDTDALLVKTIVLLQAAENPGVVPPFDGHVKKAIKAAKKARRQVGKAIAYADGTQ